MNKSTRNGLIIAAVLVTGLLIYRASKNKKKDNGEDDVSDDTADATKDVNVKVTNPSDISTAFDGKEETAVSPESVDAGDDGINYLSKTNIEKANKKKGKIKQQIQFLLAELKSLPKESKYREKSLSLKNDLALLKAQLHLT